MLLYIVWICDNNRLDNIGTVVWDINVSSSLSNNVQLVDHEFAVDMKIVTSIYVVDSLHCFDLHFLV